MYKNDEACRLSSERMNWQHADVRLFINQSVSSIERHSTCWLQVWNCLKQTDYRSELSLINSVKLFQLWCRIEGLLVVFVVRVFLNSLSLWFSNTQRIKIMCLRMLNESSHITSNSITQSCSGHVKPRAENLSCLFDLDLKFNKKIKSVVKSSFYHRRVKHVSV